MEIDFPKKYKLKKQRFLRVIKVGVLDSEGLDLNEQFKLLIATIISSWE